MRYIMKKNQYSTYVVFIEKIFNQNFDQWAIVIFIKGGFTNSRFSLAFVAE